VVVSFIISESYLTREKKERAFDNPKSNEKSAAFIFRGKNLAHQQCTNGVKPKKVGYFLMGEKRASRPFSLCSARLLPCPEFYSPFLSPKIELYSNTLWFFQLAQGEERTFHDTIDFNVISKNVMIQSGADVEIPCSLCDTFPTIQAIPM
jgi:hypothetical protein